ncbi:MAG TPA: aldo/keto reductase [Propionibacteriaceae bacterium]|nr:aldo/keto reductase [Propionibacteriaceae bacterium]
MTLRTAGDSQLTVSAVGLGCNNFSRPGTATESVAGTRAVLDAALDAGVTFLDTAELYGAGGSEDHIGQALEGRRDRFVVATKFGHRAGGVPGSADWGRRGTASYITKAVEGSLSRLRTDHIDLYQMHTPDDETPIGETLEVLSSLVTAGKVRFLGNSNFSAEQLREADGVARELGLPRFVTAQNEYSLLARGVEAEVLPTVNELEMGFLPYFPLFNGLLTGKYTRTSGEGRLTRLKPEVLESVNWDQLEQYRAICAEAGVTMLQATFAWLLSRAGVCSVIAGATTPEQVAQNAEAGRTTLDAAVLDEIDALFA